MPLLDVNEAMRVLGAAQHRGSRWWYYDTRLLRVMPYTWSGVGFEPAPAFTVFEAMAVADRLAKIGAGLRADQIGPAW